MAAKGGLGRGLNNKGLGIDALIASKPASKKKQTATETKKTSPKTATKAKSATEETKIKEVEVIKEVVKEVKVEEFVDISLVSPNKNQPRKVFEESALAELADSIKNYGIISPIIVKKTEDFYEIIAGERRWRAAKLAGLKEVPVIIRDYNEQTAAEISIIENIQRENLNPIEEAKAYRRLMEEFSLRQEDIANKVAKSRTVITNSLRLLKLDERVQRMLEDKLISSGHAKAILGISDENAQYDIAQKAFHSNLSVREVERLVRTYGKSAPKKILEESEAIKAVYDDLTLRITEALGTKVAINRKDNNKGRLEIYYNSVEELEAISGYLLKNNKNNK